MNRYYLHLSVLAALLLSAHANAAKSCPAPPPREPLPMDFSEEMDFSSDTSSIEGNALVLKGNVRISMQNRMILADELSYDSEGGNLSVPGKFRLRQDSLEVEGENLNIVNQDKFTGERVRVYQLTEDRWRVSAELIELDRAGNLKLQGITATTCAEGDKGWSVYVGEITSAADAVFGSSRNIQLKVGGKSVMWIPYTIFPRGGSRRSGWLFPRGDYSSDGGLEMAAEYYFNMAPNYDLTLGVGGYSERGGYVTSEFRYLGRSSEFLLSGIRLANDTVYADEHPEEEDNADRWLGILEYRRRYGENLRLDVIGQRVSDTEYLSDFSRDLADESQDDQYLPSRAGLHYEKLGTVYSLSADRYQALGINENDWSRPVALVLDDEVRSETGWYARWNGRLEQFEREQKSATDWYSNWDGQLNRFQQEQTRGDAAEIRREYAYVGFGKRLRRPSLDLEFSLGVNHLVHSLDERALELYDLDIAEEEITQTQAEASLDLSWRLYRSFRSGGMAELNPRLYYLYREESDAIKLPIIDSGRVLPSSALLMQRRSWYGYDRLAASNRLALGLNWSFYAANHRPYLELSLVHNEGEENDENETIQTNEMPSQTFFRTSWYPGSGNSRLFAEVQHGEYAEVLDDGTVGMDIKKGIVRKTVGLSWLGSRQRGLELSWHQTSDELIGDADAGTESVVFSLWQPLSSRINFFAGAIVDLAYKDPNASATEDEDEQQELRTMFGLEYRSCCWSLRFASVERLRSEGFSQMNGMNPTTDIDNTRIRTVVEFRMNGMGSLGGKLDSSIRRWMPWHRY